MEIYKHLLVRHMMATQTKQIVPYYAGVEELPDAYVCVRWKKKFQWIHTKNIGDGMEFVFLHKRPYMIFDIDPAWFIKGVALYQQYDEENDAMKMFLYKFPKDEELIGLYNDLLSTYMDGYSIQESGNFVELLGPPITFPDPDTFIASLRVASWQAIYSFLFGCSIVYGQIDEKANQLAHIKINIPLQGTIATLESVFERLQKSLKDHGVYLKLDKYEQSLGHGLQLSVADPELLHNFAKRRSPVHTFDGIIPEERMKLCKEELLAFSHSQGGDKELMKKIEYSVLKIVKK